MSSFLEQFTSPEPTPTVHRNVGRIPGTKLPYAVCNNVQLARARKLKENIKYKNSAGYVKTKIKMVCKCHCIDFPDMVDKTKPELENILIELKVNKLRRGA